MVFWKREETEHDKQMKQKKLQIKREKQAQQSELDTLESSRISKVDGIFRKKLYNNTRYGPKYYETLARRAPMKKIIQQYGHGNLNNDVLRREKGEQMHTVKLIDGGRIRYNRGIFSDDHYTSHDLPPGYWNNIAKQEGLQIIIDQSADDGIKTQMQTMESPRDKRHQFKQRRREQRLKRRYNRAMRKHKLTRPASMPALSSGSDEPPPPYSPPRQKPPPYTSPQPSQTDQPRHHPPPITHPSASMPKRTSPQPSQTDQPRHQPPPITHPSASPSIRTSREPSHTDQFRHQPLQYNPLGQAPRSNLQIKQTIQGAHSHSHGI
jgi:hypothetical protein